MRKWKKPWFCGLCVVFLSIHLFGLGSTAEKVTTVRLSEVVRSVFYAPQYVAINKGFFAEEGLKINLSTAWGADKGAAALFSGSVDIGFFGPEAAIYVYDRGARRRLVAFAQLTKRDGSFFLAREPMPDFKWADVKGKVIVGGRPGGVPEMVMEYVLKANGVEPFTDVEIIRNLQFTATAGAFQSGIGDFIQLFEPTVSALERAGYGYVVASFGTAGGEVAYTAYHVRKDFLEKNGDLVQRFTNAIYKGQLWVQAHSVREIAEEIKGFFPDMDLDLILRAVQRYKDVDSWARTPVMTEEALNRLEDIMISAGELSRRVPYEELVDNRFALQAIREVK